MTLVVDASVACKWFVEEPGSADADKFLAGGDELVAPDLMGLGDTEVDPHKDLFHMEAQAEMLIELMETLGHRSFGLVCHDQVG